MEEVGIQFGNFNTTLEQIFTFMPLALVLVLALWRESIFFYALAVGVSTVYGFLLASSETNGSALWVAGVAIGLMGLYFLCQVALAVWRRRK